MVSVILRERGLSCRRIVLRTGQYSSIEVKGSIYLFFPVESVFVLINK